MVLTNLTGPWHLVELICTQHEPSASEVLKRQNNKSATCQEFARPKTPSIKCKTQCSFWSFIVVWPIKNANARKFMSRQKKIKGRGRTGQCCQVAKISIGVASKWPFYYAHLEPLEPWAWLYSLVFCFVFCVNDNVDKYVDHHGELKTIFLNNNKTHCFISSDYRSLTSILQSLLTMIIYGKKEVFIFGLR